jgi:flagellar motor protein MotB
MRRKRGRTVDVEEGESYYVSMTDMMVGVIFIFIIMLSYFAFEFRSTTARLTTAKHPETAALLQTAANLAPKTADIEIDYKAQVLCVPEATLSESGQGAAGQRRCFAFAPPTKASAQTASAVDAQKLLMQSLDADLRDVNVPITGETSGGSLNFRADQLFVTGTATLSPEGRRIAGDVAQTLIQRLPCLGYGVAAGANCQDGGPKLAARWPSALKTSRLV